MWYKLGQGVSYVEHMATCQTWDEKLGTKSANNINLHMNYVINNQG